MDNNQNGQNNNKNRQYLLVILLGVLISMLCMSAFSGMFGDGASQKITYDKFLSLL